MQWLVINNSLFYLPFFTFATIVLTKCTIIYDSCHINVFLLEEKSTERAWQNDSIGLFESYLQGKILMWLMHDK